jgi:UDP-glucose 4-epimerase
MKPLSILVCGGAGYIGAHMCKMLAEAGHKVTVFDNLSTGHADAVRWGKLIQGDALSHADLERAFQGETFAAVMHFSARSLVGESVRDPGLYYRNNVTGTVNLLDAMMRHGVNRFIFSSSAAVYGIPGYTPIDEKHPTVPVNPYGATKLMVERVLADYDAAYGLRSVSLRYFNAAGADSGGLLGERHEPETHLIPNVLRAALNSGKTPLQVFGNDYDTPDGTCVRDYIHVTDLCTAHLLALSHLLDGGASDVFNLGNGLGFSVLEVIRCAEKIAGRPIPFAIAARRAGDPPVLVASAEKAQRLLGWRPAHTDISGIVDSAWRWHSAGH